MLRLPKFQFAEPTTVAEAVRLVAAHEPGQALYVAGGTDLVPNMKHGLFTPELVVSLRQVAELRGIRVEAHGGLRIGAMTTLAEVSASPEVIARAPALAQAAGLVSGPQLRNMGTLGGNVMLDTRCQWYNQTHFWRQSLGYCMKKDGTECHVVKGGSRCVAAASNDTAPALMTLDAELVFRGAGGERVMLVDELWQPDGIWNKRVGREDLLVEIRIPPIARHHGAYLKLRDRGSIDFPLFGLAVRLESGADGFIARSALAAVALQARPWRLRHTDVIVGTRPGTSGFEEAVEDVAQQAHKQCIPMPNIPGNHEYRRAMVPVLVRKILRAATGLSG